MTLFLSLLTAQEIDSTKAPIKQLNETQYQLDNIIIDIDKRIITLPAEVNMQDGLVEVFLCARGGKIHESVLVSNVIPYYMKVALLLIGLKDGNDPMYTNEKSPVKGDPVTIWISWQSEGKEKKYRAESLIWNITDNATMEQTDWIFTGSRMEQGQFMADDVKSLITTYNDPSTIIDNPLVTGVNDEVYRANKNLLPPKGTAVTVIIKAKS